MFFRPIQWFHHEKTEDAPKSSEYSSRESRCDARRATVYARVHERVSYIPVLQLLTGSLQQRRKTALETSVTSMVVHTSLRMADPSVPSLSLFQKHYLLCLFLTIRFKVLLQISFTYMDKERT